MFTKTIAEARQVARDLVTPGWISLSHWSQIECRKKASTLLKQLALLVDNSQQARSGPRETSQKAAASVSLRSGSQKVKLLRAYENCGGLTDYAAASHALLANEGTCWWKRCSELRQAGLIVDTGLVEKSPLTGEECIVCSITNLGMKVLRDLEVKP